MDSNQKVSSVEIGSGDANYVSHDQEPKRGHVFCGVCCDTRTACIVVNIVSLAFAGLGLVGLAPQMDRVGFERFGIVIAIFVLGVLNSALGLFGALKFKKTFILIATVWFGIEAILALIIFRDIFACLTSIFFFYPHIVFYRELLDGIMTRDTFPREKDCCGSCC